jgi:hypothetical protein
MDISEIYQSVVLTLPWSRANGRGHDFHDQLTVGLQVVGANAGHIDPLRRLDFSIINRFILQ